MTISQILAKELAQKIEYIDNVIGLIDEGNTIPFIARYRKEMHGAMDDTLLRTLETRLTYLRNLENRRDEVKRSIENQGKLTQELSDAIDAAATMTEVEDLYRPYKQKRRTRASAAREKGLEPLAAAIFAQDGSDPAILAQDYVSEDKGVNSLEEAKQLKAAVLAHPELKYMAAENCFYWAFIQSWKQMYEEGKLGQAVYAEAEYLHSQDFREIKAENHPKEHWRSFNPAIKYLTHDLGPLLYILDDKCVSVSCMEPDIRYNPYRATPNNGVALFKTAKGAVIRILVCFDAYVHADHNYAIIGTRGNIATDKTVSVDTAHSFASFSDIPGTLEQKIEIPVTTRFAGEPAGGHGGADGKMVRDFVRCILDDTKPPIDVDMAIRISLPGIIAHESAVQGGTALEIPEI